MNTTAGYELAVVAGAMACGAALAFLYDLFRVKRRLVKTSAIFINIEDVLFWLIAAVIVFLASYIISSGETRFYFFSGIFIGGLIYFTFLSKFVVWALTGFIRAILWPFRKLAGLLAPVGRAIAMKLRMFFGGIRNTIAIKAYHIGVDMRRLRNAMTKK
jgi:Spore cortex protein YabQ (Spore_YabQ).